MTNQLILVLKEDLRLRASTFSKHTTAHKNLISMLKRVQLTANANLYIVYTLRCTSLGILNTIAFTYKKNCKCKFTVIHVTNSTHILINTATDGAENEDNS